MNKPIPALNKICFKKDMERDYNLLYSKIKEMKPMVDSRVPLNYENLKKNIPRKRNPDKVWLMKIENKALVRRINSIEKHKQEIAKMSIGD